MGRGGSEGVEEWGGVGVRGGEGVRVWRGGEGWK